MQIGAKAVIPPLVVARVSNLQLFPNHFGFKE
jgi:hypothetical protein